MSTTLLIILGAALLLVVSVPLIAARRSNLPTVAKDDLSDEERVAVFVSAFLERDSRARQLLNSSNTFLFAEGYRPVLGVPNDPEASGDTFIDLPSYFIRKVYLDVNSIQPLAPASFQSFLDQLHAWGYHTLTGGARIIEKYDLHIEGRFHFPTEVAKVPPGEEQEQLLLCWLNDAVLATEFRMLAWIFRQLFGTPYVIPERRHEPS